MGSFRGVCTSQQQQMRRTDFELATLCTPMRTMLAYFRMIVLWGSLWGVCGEFRMTVLWGQKEEGALVGSFCVLCSRVGRETWGEDEAMLIQSPPTYFKLTLVSLWAFVSLSQDFLSLT